MQIVGQLLGRVIALVYFLCQALEADRFQIARHTRLQPAWRQRILRPHLLERNERSLATEWSAAAQRLIENRAERVHIRRRADLVAAAGCLFRSHVAGST